MEQWLSTDVLVTPLHCVLKYVPSLILHANPLIFILPLEADMLVLADSSVLTGRTSE
jgi:hypothetical protein